MATYLKKPITPSSTNGASPSTSTSSVPTIVSSVIADIRANGDAGVRSYSQKFDSWSPPSFKLSQEQIEKAIAACPKQLIEDIKTVQGNVRRFAQAQKDSLRDFEVEVEPGVKLGQKNIPVGRVGA